MDCSSVFIKHRANHSAGDVLMGVVDAFDVYEMQDTYKQYPFLFEKGRLRVLTLLAAAASLQMMDGSVESSRDDSRQRALEFIGRADKIDASCETTKLCKAIFWIGELHHDTSALRNARYHADLVLHKENSSDREPGCNHVVVLICSP